MNLSALSRGIAALTLAVGLMLGGGCIKIDATLTVNREGGGSLRAMYAMPAFLVKQLEVTRQWSRSLDAAAGVTNQAAAPELDIPMIFDEVLVRNKLQNMADDGVQLDTLKTREQGGWKYVDFTLKYNRLDRLMKQSFFKACGVSLRVVGDDTCKLSATLPESCESLASGTLGGADAASKLIPFLNGMRVVVRIDLPGEIRNSTSLMSDNRRATWEWDYDKDPNVLSRLAREKIIVVFDGSQARLNDFEKPAGSSLLLKQ